jgi:NitT/TauT family transport system substrate-binding protein
MPLCRFTSIALALFCAAFLGSCNKGANYVPDSSHKIRVGYIGITCEAPIFSAVENGYFKEEGLDVELVKCEWSQYKDVLALGGFDITHHLIMYFLKPIEQGLDVKISGGIHPGMGTPPFIFCNRVLGANGIDAKRDVEWRVFPAGELGLALQKGEVDAICDSEPIGTLLLAQGIVYNVADQGKDAPYKDEYCCAVIVNGNYFRNNPKNTAAATRAMLKGAKWVAANPRAAARLSVEKHYLASNPELNTSAIGNLLYLPSISGAEKAVHSAAAEMKKAGMLGVHTDVEALAKKAFVQLDGVTDDWIKTIHVDTVADGQIPPDQPIRLAQEIGLMTDRLRVATCCGPAKK